MENIPVIRTIRGALRVNRENQLSAFAAQAAFFLLLSFFPFVMILLISVRFLPVTQAEFTEMVTSLFPNEMLEYFNYMVEEIYSSPVSATMLVSVIVAVWTEDTKNYFLRRLMNAFYTLIFCVMLIAFIGVYVLGNTIMETIVAKTKWGDFSETIFFYSRLLTAPVLVFAVILLIYCRLPDNHLRLKTAIPGAVFTTVCWVFLSAAFSAYISYFGINTYMYGNLGGMVIAMLWMYVCMYILLLGAEMNLFFRDELRTIYRKIKEFIRQRKSNKKESKKERIERNNKTERTTRKT